MKLNNIVKELQNTTPESFEVTGHRRDILKSFGAKVAAMAVPLVGASLFNKAQAKTTDVLAEGIYFGLTATDMLIAFYTKALATTGLIPADSVGDFTTILDHHKAHWAYWSGVLSSTGNAAAPTASYDFTAKNAFPKTFADYGSFLTLAHTLQDVGVRIYVTAIQYLVTNKALRGDAINVRCVMARDAAHIRLLRRNTGVDIMPWITNAEANTIVGELIQGYTGEEVTRQGDYEIININGAKVSMKAASQAFDEPMGVLESRAFIRHFID